MERKQFLKRLGASAFILPFITACSQQDDPKTTSTTTGTTTTSTTTSSGGCVDAPVETAGPFPTHTPSTLVLTDITGDRTGIPLSIKITVQNKSDNCSALSNAIVDIWHCDKDGYYSEYGGSGMQTIDYTGSQYHFLRGRQTTGANGQVGFTSIFPGWYSGRATHIHVHVYNSSGTSLMITQIAFPEGSASAVSLVNASTSNGYTKGMTGYTYNASDNVFSDSYATEIATVTGSISDGYILDMNIIVSA